MHSMPKRNIDKAIFLVTGGAGFIGSNFVRFLVNNIPGSRIIVVDNLSYAGRKDNLNDLPKNRVSFYKFDINETRKMAALMKKVDYVVHFAAESHVDRSIYESTKDFTVANVLGTQSMLEALGKSPNVKLFIHISTDEVFGTLPLDSRKEFRETSPYYPNSPYAATKAGADMLVRSYIQTWHLPIIIVHPVNNYGPYQLPEKLVPFFTLRALQNLPLPIYGHGKFVRSWLHVDDCCSAILLLIKKGKAGENYCVSSGEKLANIEITKKILETLDKPASLITHIANRPGHDERYALNSSKIRKLGWKPKHKIKDYLPKTVLWYKDNQEWARRSNVGRKVFNSHIKLK